MLELLLPPGLQEFLHGSEITLASSSTTKLSLYLSRKTSVKLKVDFEVDIKMASIPLCLLEYLVYIVLYTYVVPMATGTVLLGYCLVKWAR